VQALHALVTFLDNRAYQAIGRRTDLERKQAQHQRRHGRCSGKVGQQVRHARLAEARALALVDDVAVPARWLQQDVLTVSGPSYADPCVLYDFIVAELRARE
jgi:hypothetical protein